MKASDWIANFFVSHGIHAIYGYIGGMITHLVDSISRHPDMCFVQTYHEQSAAFMAVGSARRTKRPGIALATSGPGATNLLTGVADAYFDSVPVIFITGQVNTYEYKYDKPVRQQGFQELDIVSMARPVTKWAVLLDDPAQICYVFEKAWHVAMSGRPGPVLIDLPMNISRAAIEPENLTHFVTKDQGFSLSEREYSEIRNALHEAERPLLLLGGGARPYHALADAVVTNGFPVVVSLQGKGAVDESFDTFAGMLGSYGNRSANMAVARADLLVVVGSRLDTRQTGARLEEFGKGRRIIHIDVDDKELECHRLSNRMTFQGNAGDVLKWLAFEKFSASSVWLSEIKKIKERYSQEKEVVRFVGNALPYQYMEALNRQASNSDCFVVDVGQNQMWAAQSLQMNGERMFLTSGGLAAMGYAVPVAVGVSMADANCVVWAITGDGGLQMAMQSLPLISQYRLPVRVLVMNNSSLGMITQFQSLYFNSCFAGTTVSGGYLPPDCEKLAAAFKLPYFRLERADEADKILKELPPYALVEAVIPFPTVVSPKLHFDHPFYDMAPFLPEEELKHCMSGLS